MAGYDDDILFLARVLDQHFKIEELKTLCFDMRVDDEAALIGDGKPAKVRTLIDYMNNRGRLIDLVNEVIIARENIPEVSHLREMQGRLASAAPERDGANALATYHRGLIEKWSKPEYRLDTRFVRITLLVEQEQRLVEPERPDEFKDVRDILRKIDDPAVVLLGAPGSGKTTLLRRLQMDHSRDCLANGSMALTFLKSFNEYPREHPPEPLDWLQAEWRSRHPALPSLDDLMRTGRLLLLLDALNEMRHHDKADLDARLERWRSFLRMFAGYGNRAVFTCRTQDYGLGLSSDEARVRQANVKPLTPPQIREFLDLHLPEQAEVVWKQLESSPKLLELFGTPYYLKLLTEDPNVRRADIPKGRAALFTSLVRRSLAHELEDVRNPLLMHDGALLDEHDRAQIVRGRWKSTRDLPEAEDGGCLILKLSALAFGMQRSGLQGGEATHEAPQVRASLAEAARLLDHARANDILKAGTELGILDADAYVDRSVLFVHQLLQEYFAARQFARQLDPALVQSEWRADRISPYLDDVLARLPDYEPLLNAPTTGWEQTATMAAAMTTDADAFVRAIAEVNLPLAADCAAAPDVRVSRPMKQQLQQALIARTEDSQADLRARIAAGLALGRLDDPRFELREGPHGQYLMPPLVTIPVGEYPIGDDESDYDREKPAHKVKLDEFQIGRFPVTNAEYSLFIRAGGYEEKGDVWWETDEAKAWRRGEGQVEGQRQSRRDDRATLQGWTEDYIRGLHSQGRITSKQRDDWLPIRNLSDEEFNDWLELIFPSDRIAHEPRYWDDPSFNNPAQPIVGICWFEACAFCAWLSAQTGLTFRLPTEAEWEAAARGRVGRKFVYGDTFDPTKCNTFESYIRRTTPVGVFPGGETPIPEGSGVGIADLCGNAWEWCADWFDEEEYQRRAGKVIVNPIGPSQGKYRAVRGSSWDYSQDLARAAFRFRFNPHSRNYFYIGFRVVGGSALFAHSDL